jgi:methylmalonyl-CoA decarboxylase
MKHTDYARAITPTGVDMLDVANIGDIRVVTFNRPEQRNALGEELLGYVQQAIEQLPAPRAMILQAMTDVSTWSAGHDISEIPTDGKDPLSWSNPLERTLRVIEHAPFPIIAAVHGGVWGGACDLVMTCDLVVAARDSTFAITPTKLGVPYNAFGIGHFLSAMPVHIAKQMFFTAEPITADQAHQWGIVNVLAQSAADSHEVARTLATTIASRAPLSIKAIKAEFTALSSPPPQSVETSEHLTGLRRDAWESMDFREGIRAFMEKRSPSFTGE